MANSVAHSEDATTAVAQSQESQQESMEDIRRLARNALIKAMAGKPPIKTVAPLPPSTGTARESSDVAQLRLQAQRALIQAANDGRLATALAGKCSQSQTQGTPQGSQLPGGSSRCVAKKKYARGAFAAPPMPKQEDPRDLDELLRELGEETTSGRSAICTASKRKGGGKVLKVTDARVQSRTAPTLEGPCSAAPLAEAVATSSSASSTSCSQEDASNTSTCLRSEDKDAASVSEKNTVREDGHIASTITASIVESCVVSAGACEVAEEEVHSCSDDNETENMQNMYIMTPVRRKRRGRKHSSAALAVEVSLPAERDCVAAPEVSPAAEKQASVQPSLAEVQDKPSTDLAHSKVIDSDSLSRQPETIQQEQAAQCDLILTVTTDRAVQTLPLRSKQRLPMLPPPPKGTAPPPPVDMQLWPSTPEVTPVPSPRGGVGGADPAGLALEHKEHTTELGMPGTEIALAGQPGAWLFVPTHLLADVQRVIIMSGCGGPEVFKQAAYGLPLAVCCDTPWAT